LTPRAPAGGWLVLVACLLPAGVGLRPAVAQPALDRARAAGALTVYPDAEVPGRFYYLPGPLELATRNDRPAVDFLLTRRTGTHLTGDQLETRFFAHLSFDVEMKGVGAEELAEARRALIAAGVSRPEIRILPLRRTEAQVVFAPIGGGEEVSLPEGDFELAEAGEQSVVTQRRYTLRLDRENGEAIWGTLEHGRALVSFSYAYVAEGAMGTEDALEVVDQNGSRVDFRAPETEAESEAARRVVRADAFQVTLDAERYPDLIRIVDLNAERPPPPGFGILDIRCYDFKNQLRPDLAMKMVELRGEAVNGRAARKLVIFRASEPDAAIHRVRFPFAVRLDAPLRYRVREIATDGEEIDLGWQERSWIGLLDVTTDRARLVQADIDIGDGADLLREERR
jgi:hypothetical protein